MRHLNTQEMKQASGCLLFVGLKLSVQVVVKPIIIKPVLPKLSLCLPKPPVCQPKPVC